MALSIPMEENDVRKDGENMVDTRMIHSFFHSLNASGIQYVVKKNDGNSLPSFLPENKDLDILVHPKDYLTFRAFMLSEGYDLQNGMSCKYYFVYAMQPDLFFVKGDFHVHAFAQLACISLPNMGLSMLPLHRDIQKDIWEKKRWIEKDAYWIMDDGSIYLYILVRSILDRKGFRPSYRAELERLQYVIADSDFQKKLELVFFKFSNELLRLLHEKKYDEIYSSYVSFSDY